MLLVFTAPSSGPCFSLPCLTQAWAPKSARASHWRLREACRMSSIPHPRQGPRTSPCAQHPSLRQGPRTPVCPASSPQTGAKDPPCAQHPSLRQEPRTPVCPASSPQTGLRTRRVPSILAPDRGSGPPVCPASSPQTGAQDPPCAQHPRLIQGLRTPVCPASSSQTGARDHPCAQHRVPQTDVSKAFSAQQCAHKGERECLQVSPQEPETTRAKTHHLLLAEPPGGWGQQDGGSQVWGRGFS